jgi:FkbM family methyltransferase
MISINTEEELYHFFASQSHTYIFGAGTVGRTVLYTLASRKLTINGFIVSKRESIPDNIWGIPVLTIDELSHIDSKPNILIATLPNLHEEISKTLIQADFHDFATISKQLYCAMRVQQGDDLPDITYLFANISNKIEQINGRVGQVEQILTQEIIGKRLPGHFYVHTEAEHKRHSSSLGNQYWSDENSNQREIDFINLVKGLDLDSIKTVSLILERLRVICQKSEDKILDLFLPDEQEQLRELHSNFFPYIYRVSKNMYCYSGYFLPVEHFDPNVFYYKYGIDLLKNPKFIAGKDVIDAGAYVGDSALILRELTDGTIHAFEADKRNCELIPKTLEWNQLTDVKIINAALGDKNGEISLNIGEVFNRINTIMDISNRPLQFQGTVKVKQQTIDAYVEKNGIKVGLIKSDIEGAESMMLRGAENTLRTQRPTLLISIYHNMNDFIQIKPWLEDLDVGYSFKIFHPTIPNFVIEETILIAESE